MAGYNADGAPGQGFNPIGKGRYVIKPPVFETEAKQRDSGPLWVGRCEIAQSVSGNAGDVGNHLGVFLRDPMYDTEALGRLRTILARHGLSPDGLTLGDMSELVKEVNELCQYGQPANIMVSDDGFIQDHRFPVEDGANALVVFEDFAFFDLGQFPKDGGRYVYRPEQTTYKGKERVNYRCDVLLRRVDDGPWQNHLGNYAFLNYTLVGYLSEDGSPMIGPAAGGQSRDTNFTRFMAAGGITDIVQQVFVPGGEALDRRVVEAADGNGRPYILEWIRDALIEMRNQGHVMTCPVDREKGFLDARNLQVAGPAQLRQMGMPDQVPTLLTLDEARASGKAPVTVQAPTKTQDDSSVSLDQAMEMYNTWSRKWFDGAVTFQDDNGNPKPTNEHKQDILVPYLLPILQYGSPDGKQAGNLGVSREGPCRMDKQAFDILVKILNDQDYINAIAAQDDNARQAILDQNLGSLSTDDGEGGF